MSQGQLTAFIEKVKDNTSLKDKLKSAADANSALAIAKEAGFVITAEDIQSMQSATDLSDAELEGVAGGGNATKGWQSCAGCFTLHRPCCWTG